MNPPLISEAPLNLVTQKLQQLSQQRLQEVEDFIDFLLQKDTETQWIEAAARNSEAAFAQIWDNAEDAAYDQL